MYPTLWYLGDSSLFVQMKKEWMLFSLVYIPPVHDEWTDFIIPPQGLSDLKLKSQII
jgi:hypothetical protein